MKNIVISFVLFIILMFLIFIPIRYLNKVCSSLSGDADDLELLITNEKWNDSYTSSVQILESWQEHKNTFSIFVPHIEIDNVNMEMYKLSQYVKCQDKTESLSTIHLIKFLVNHLEELNKANIQNIF